MKDKKEKRMSIVAMHVSCAWDVVAVIFLFVFCFSMTLIPPSSLFHELKFPLKATSVLQTAD